MQSSPFMNSHRVSKHLVRNLKTNKFLRRSRYRRLQAFILPLYS